MVAEERKGATRPCVQERASTYPLPASGGLKTRHNASQSHFVSGGAAYTRTKAKKMDLDLSAWGASGKQNTLGCLLTAESIAQLTVHGNIRADQPGIAFLRGRRYLARRAHLDGPDLV